MKLRLQHEKQNHLKVFDTSFEAVGGVYYIQVICQEEEVDRYFDFMSFYYPELQLVPTRVNGGIRLVRAMYLKEGDIIYPFHKEYNTPGPETEWAQVQGIEKQGSEICILTPEPCFGDPDTPIWIIQHDHGTDHPMLVRLEDVRPGDKVAKFEVEQDA